jgi:hypothetical protein
LKTSGVNGYTNGRRKGVLSQLLVSNLENEYIEDPGPLPSILELHPQLFLILGFSHMSSNPHPGHRENRMIVDQCSATLASVADKPRKNMMWLVSGFPSMYKLAMAASRKSALQKIYHIMILFHDCSMIGGKVKKS